MILSCHLPNIFFTAAFDTLRLSRFVNFQALFLWQLLVCASLLCLPTHLAAQSLPSNNIAKVTFLVGADPNAPFWDSQIHFAQSVAKALNVELSVIYIPAKYMNRFGVAHFMATMLKDQLQHPDLIISTLWLGTESKILMLLNRYHIPLISINTHLSTKLIAEIGLPREKFPYWLGHISTDDVKTGKMLTEYLLKQVNQNKGCNLPCPINLFAFSGATYASASLEREKGLKQVVANVPKVNLFNVVHANWDRDTAKSMMATVLNRHDDIDAFWVASDAMTLGVIEGFKEKGQNITPVIGSIDWSPEIVEYIRTGEVDISYGGHFMEAGWALTLFVDYLKVSDFVEISGTVIKIKLAQLTFNEIEGLGSFLLAPVWSAEVIRSHSRFYNDNFSEYQFDPEFAIGEHVRRLSSGLSH